MVRQGSEDKCGVVRVFGVFLRIVRLWGGFGKSLPKHVARVPCSFGGTLCEEWLQTIGPASF